MSLREIHYRWEWELGASPAALWPLVADTNRFDHDARLPPVQRISNDAGRQRVRFTKLGLNIEWEELPFEWVRPWRFGVVRRYRSGPIEELRTRTQFAPRAPSGGTRVIYDVHATPRNWLGVIFVRAQIGILARRTFEKIFRAYDAQISSVAAAANAALPPATPSRTHGFAPGGEARLTSACKAAIDAGADPAILDQLRNHIAGADDLALSRIRAYALADRWGMPRRAVLETCLRATRAGMLELRWDVMCPLCRGTKQSAESLASVPPGNVHCDACLISFDINFDRLVELTFRPSASVRPHRMLEYCVGGPGNTPHIIVQQRLAACEIRSIDLPLEPGRYRARAMHVQGSQSAIVDDAAPSSARISLGDDPKAPWPHDEVRLGTRAMLTLENRSPREQVMILERLAWTDTCTTAAEVFAMQVFRDLFAEEALRPGQQVSVGSICILFTDLRDSTRMYRAIGDAPAFGRVMSHFDVLRDAIAREQGAMVKTIGDAVMAVFARPVCAIRAIRAAHKTLAKQAATPSAEHPLILKAGIHFGPAIAVTLNGRLDYFGSTINLASRLQSLSAGNDLIVSDAVRHDPEVAAELAHGSVELVRQASLKGFDQQRHDLWRIVFRPA